MIDVTNAHRADLALAALHDFVVNTKVDTARDAIADLISNLIHLARGRGLDAEQLVAEALGMTAQEVAEDPEGDMASVQRSFRTLFPSDS